MRARLAALCLLAAAPVRAAEIRVESGPGGGHQVSALALSTAERARLAAEGAEAFAGRLAVFTRDGVPPPGTPQVAGSYRLDEHGLHFQPLFPFVPGLRYTVRLELGGPPRLHGFEAVPVAGEAPRVVAVFPSGETLPENALRLYVHFSRPMEARDAHRHVRLLDEVGRAVPLAFVEVPHGLWDPGRTRLTVLFHPGRIKRGVAPGERLGLPLRAGGRYRLVVDGAMRDARGLQLRDAFSWAIEAGAADRAPPRAEGLRVHAPGSPASAVTLELPEPLDEALLHRLVWVEDSAGLPVGGACAISDGETRWSFRPSQPWTPGPYAVRLHPALEDRAGNRFGRAFDREAAAEPARPDQRLALRLPFSVPAAGP